MVHTEVVLKCDSGESLGGGLYLDALLRLDGLMETIAVTASLHDSAGLLVDNLDFSVVDHIFIVFLEESVSLEKLGDGVDAL